uniref:putative quinol monooxygenase n=1 Tax=Burkholderia vietnamiensis TaxID=60552 RepID=UPI000AA3BAA6|nr:antibiotic biosynthesis monooxygenase family protein [Burkholderia vietnamiensis]
MSKQYVVATITADPRHVAAVEDALLSAVPAVRNEDGCEQYELHRHRDASHRFTMIERWRDEHALRAWRSAGIPDASACARR